MLPLPPDCVRQLLAELKAGLAALYGERLRGVYLFGSYARGEATPDSDLDVLIVLDRVDHYWGEITRSGWLISDLALQYDVPLSRAFTSHEDWESGATFFLQTVRPDAIAA